MKKEKPIYLWKSLPKNMSPHGYKYVVGKWCKEDNISICNKGFHASMRSIDAMRYVECEILAKVEVRGESQKEKDKQCWSEMKLVKIWKWTEEDSVAMAIYAAELVEPIYRKRYSKDTRIIEAIEAAKKVLKSDTAKNRKAAVGAARAAEAAAEAAGAARAAAWAARAAAWAARAAARAARAAGAARAAAWAAEAEKDFGATLDKIETWIHKRKKL